MTDAPKHGWHTNRMTRDHVVFDVLWIQGVASVERFNSPSLFYPNATDPQGVSHRGGGREEQANAMEWCERITGYKVTR